MHIPVVWNWRLSNSNRGNRMHSLNQTIDIPNFGIQIGGSNAPCVRLTACKDYIHLLKCITQLFQHVTISMLCWLCSIYLQNRFLFLSDKASFSPARWVQTENYGRWITSWRWFPTFRIPKTIVTKHQSWMTNLIISMPVIYYNYFYGLSAFSVNGRRSVCRCTCGCCRATSTLHWTLSTL